MRWGWRLPALAVVGLGASGCAFMLLGAGAAGGYAVSADSITNRLDQPAAVVYGVSQQVLEDQGLIMEQNEARGRLKAQVDGANVTVTVKPLGAQTAELRVRARNRFWMPRMPVAQRVYNAILERL